MLNRIFAPRRTVHAHCDLPCGVYDPAQARIEAESVQGLPGEVRRTTRTRTFRARAVAIKEERADLVKHHLWVLWTDYFKPEHLEQLPATCTTCSGARRRPPAPRRSRTTRRRVKRCSTSIDEIAKIFWETKN